MDKSLSVGHLLTTIVLVASAVAAFYSLSERIAVVEDRIILILENQTKIDAGQDATLNQLRTDMRNSTIDINDKLKTILDHLLEQ